MGSGPKEIKELVERFERNIESYKGQGYNEAQVRREFIDPFFEALGWDVANKGGTAAAYKDVIHEDAIKIGGTTKAPDYCFRIGPAKKFFVEAKKPAVDIKSDISPAYQLRRYAWSAKLPLSILTDFEEFAVYDCQIRPNVNDKPSTARIFYCTYKEYSEKWEQIANIFGKEAVRKGLFDTYASEKTTKRGTTTVDKEFLAEIEGWRDDLAKNIAIRNGKLSVYDLNFAVQKTIDRILFLRICEDRAIERSEQLLGLINGSRIYPRLFELFEKADEKYNSGIFHFRREKDRPEGPDELSANLKVDDDVLKKIIRNLYYPCPYVFSEMPAEILGQVYEQFLGKVIRLTASHQAKVEEKPEVKKAGGVYYTPSYIVDYIVKNTVGKLCESKLATEDTENTEKINILKTPAQVAKLRILDPACGSGSFLIGAYQYLLDYHRDYYAKEPSKHKKAIYQGKGGQWFLTIDEKKRILLNNIYGVDIDSQAAEVTKLSLLLKVLENETQESLRLFHERALPDLGNNIKCGNSLIGPDIYENQQLSFFDDEQQRKINAFDWQNEFSEILTGNNPGFDCIIGNPPYVQVLHSERQNELLYFAKHYVSTSAFKKNLFPLFIERCLSLIKADKARFSMIIPDRFFFTPSYIPCRQCIIQKAQIESICEILSGAFEQAIVGNAIFFLTTPPQNSYNIIIEKWDYNRPDIINRLAFKNINSDPEVVINLLITEQANDILKKCHKISVDLKELMFVHVGVMIKDNKSLFTKEKTNNKQKPIVKGRQFARYALLENSYFNPSKAIIFGGTKNWEKHEQSPKILLRKTGDTIIGYLDSDSIYAEQSVYLLLPKSDINPSFVLGILNSKFLTYLFQKCFITNPVAYPYIQHYDLEKLPIRKIDLNNHNDINMHNQMVSFVEQMLELHKKLAGIKNPDEKTRIQRQIDATDAQIDKLVYELYGLTAEEIGIVEKTEDRI